MCRNRSDKAQSRSDRDQAEMMWRVRPRTPKDRRDIIEAVRTIDMTPNMRGGIPLLFD